MEPLMEMEMQFPDGVVGHALNTPEVSGKKEGRMILFRELGGGWGLLHRPVTPISHIERSQCSII